MSNKATLNKNLHKAKEAKYDDFYTQLNDIENELRHYKEHFKRKIVYCNCDDPTISDFHKYFRLKFDELGLKKLITTCYKNKQMTLFSTNSDKKAVWLEYEGTKNTTGIPDEDLHEVRKKYLKGDGDFRSNECIELLKQADIVVTNPPFSLFREYVTQLMMYNKKFIIIGNMNAITYKDIFQLIMENKIWLGYKSGDMAFKVPNDSKPRTTRYWQDEKGQKWRSFGNICWFTNLDIKKRHEDLKLGKTYKGHEEEYPKYDNYDVINVDEFNNIPEDYTGVMGVPIGFLDKHNPKQFDILGIANSARWIGYECFTIINGKKIYNRILIKRR